MSHALAFTHTRPASTDARLLRCAAAVAQPAIAYDDAIAAALRPLVALLDTLPPQRASEHAGWPSTCWKEPSRRRKSSARRRWRELATAVAAAQARLAAVYGDDLPIAIADGRYQFAHQVAQQVVSGRSAAPTQRPHRPGAHPSLARPGALRRHHVRDVQSGAGRGVALRGLDRRSSTARWLRARPHCWRWSARPRGSHRWWWTESSPAWAACWRLCPACSCSTWRWGCWSKAATWRARPLSWTAS
ncbi:MAG: hypothetical protein R3A10_08455 [Caldilineaceae bacterium]